jgi:hypothetical protein
VPAHTVHDDMVAAKDDGVQFRLVSNQYRMECLPADELPPTLSEGLECVLDVFSRGRVRVSQAVPAEIGRIALRQLETSWFCEEASLVSLVSG